MYGRCETDPFDQATDVCDSCYGEFCSACLVKTKGRKHSVCKECTIIASGVRPGAKPLLRGSKKSAAKRRKALQQAPEESPSFEYFDDARPSEPAEAAAPAEGTGDESEENGEADDQALVSTSPPPITGSEATGEATEPGPVEEPSVTSARSVTPGLAALAQHQAERSGHLTGRTDDDPASVPAPDWLTAPVDGAIPFADDPIEAEAAAAAVTVTVTVTEAATAAVTAAAAAAAAVTAADSEPEAATGGESDVAIEADGPIDDAGEPAGPTGGLCRRTPIDDRAKPVTEGFDWVTELPARGSSNPLPSRARAEGIDESAEQPAGAVATVEAPPAALPRRRSTLRSPDDNRR